MALPKFCHLLLLTSVVQAYDELRVELIRMERHLLKEMGFICHVEHPHKFIPVYLEVLGVKDPAVQQEAWSLANDRYSACSLFLPTCSWPPFRHTCYVQL